MADKKLTFEENLAQLEAIVNELETGDVPLEKAMTAFQKGVKLSQTLEETLSKAEKTMAKVMADNGEEVLLDAEGQE
ncbi:exodeoxyribonuclease VII small subunit [Latilactobacillus fragifolii]|uniref:exodeoxyribonuclease VII small subunit n=1 Tax=Latilactobacillus fragifolii TaxID=2814244 RepID=UPI001ABBA29B|nr:exodeoxyribonuclease VII small subunit [Latilactobacillus fragifolii]